MECLNVSFAPSIPRQMSVISVRNAIWIEITDIDIEAQLAAIEAYKATYVRRSLL